MGLLSEKTEALYVELNRRVEAVILKQLSTCSYTATGIFLRYIYSVLVAKNNQKVRSKCLVYEFSFPDIFQQL